MIRRENPNFRASIYAPNPQEVSYWVDLKEGPDGQVIKTYVNNQWVRVNDLLNDEQNSLLQSLQSLINVLKDNKLDYPEGGNIGLVLKKTSEGVSWLNDNDTTYNNATNSTSGLMSASDKSKLDSIANNANNYVLPVASTSTIGGVKSSTTGTAVDRDYLVQVNADGTMKVNVPWTDANTTYNVATTAANGLMSSTDKSKLDNISDNANNYLLPNATTSIRGGVLQGTAVEDLLGTEDTATICTKINSLLASLRTAGILVV